MKVSAKDKHKYKYYVADFETTVYSGQERTEVWAAAIVELFTDDVKIFHSINELWDFMVAQNCNLCVYFHNLKFDGSFWIPFFLRLPTLYLFLYSASISHWRV